MENEINSRREFLRINSLGGLGIFVAGALGGCATGSHSTSQKKFETGHVQTLSDMNLEEIRETYRAQLFQRFLPNMDKYVIDHDLGGFMCWVNIETGKQENSKKRTWFQGRGIWTYSFLYNNFEKNPAYLEIARKAKDFILKSLPPDDQFYPSEYTKEGVPISNEQGDIYGNLFLAEGLAEYAKASGESKYFVLAKKIIINAVAKYDRPDFDYPYRAQTRIAGPRILGHWMILLSLTTQMLRQEWDREIVALADRCVEAIMNHHLNRNFRLMNEAVSHDFKPLADSIASVVADIGHACETLAFVMNYAVLRKDSKLFNAARDEFKRHVSVSADPIYGGYFHILDDAEKYTWGVVTKTRWLPEEILIGSLIMLEHTGDPWAINCFLETEAYLREKFLHPEYLFVVDGGDRQLATYSKIRAENYHYPRHLMVTILGIDRILNRGRKPSGIVS